MITVLTVYAEVSVIGEIKVFATASTSPAAVCPVVKEAKKCVNIL